MMFCGDVGVFIVGEGGGGGRGLALYRYHFLPIMLISRIDDCRNSR